jgi:hypothetical protein
MTPGLRKFTLTAHVTFSVGWLGAVVAYLAVAIACLVSQDVQIVRSGYSTMELTGWFVIVPLSLAALLTGLVQSLGTEWGLFRYYWILVKCVLTVGAVTILLLHMSAVSRRSGVLAEGGQGPAPSLVGSMPMASRRSGVPSEVVHSGGGLLVLLATTTLSVYKPWGKTRYGRLKQQERRDTRGGTLVSSPLTLSDTGNDATRDAMALGLKIFLAIVVVSVAVFISLHLTGCGHGSHGP